MRILWLGSGAIGLPSLEWLIVQSGHEVVGCVCQPDKPAGRKLILTPPPIKPLAERHGIQLWQPERIKEVGHEIEALKADLLVVMAYGQYLPKSVREAGKFGCINLHASLLPRWRGASPIQAAMVAGDPETGVTVMHVAAGMDTGDMVSKEITPILDSDTGQSLHDRLGQVAATALARALPGLFDGTAQREPQNEAEATHCAKLSRESGRVVWGDAGKVIERTMRAYDPWPGTSTTLPDGRVLKLFPPVQAILSSADTSHGDSPRPGTILERTPHSLTIQTGDGALCLLNDVQPQDKRRMKVSEFLAGTAISVGERLV